MRVPGIGAVPRVGLAVAALALVVAPRPAAAQGAAPLQPLDPAYRELERLRAFGLVDTAFVGHRPWSRDEVARQAAEAGRNVGRLDPPRRATAEDILNRLLRRFGDGAPLLTELRADLTWTDGRPRSVPPNDLARWEADVAPLTAHDQGRDPARGTTAGLEAEAVATLGPHVAVALRPRADLSRGPGALPDRERLRLHAGHLRAVLGGAALTAGRVHAVWGQAVHGGLALSHNARAPLTVRVETARPVTLPWVLGALGPSRHAVAWADLGTEGRAFPHAFLLTLRSSFQPRPGLEVGVGVISQQGGEGAPGASVLERVADLLILPAVLDREAYRFSQKMAVFDIRARFPSLGAMEAYLEGSFDDFDIGGPATGLWQDAGWVLGARWAALDEAGRLGLTLEGQHTGLRFYGHMDFTGGMTLERRLLGSELGPDANGLLARVDLDPGNGRSLAVEAAWERRSNDRWILVEEDPYRFERTARLPKETRWRMVASVARLDGDVEIDARAGLERIRSFAFAAGDDRIHGLLRAVVTWRPGSGARR